MSAEAPSALAWQEGVLGSPAKSQPSLRERSRQLWTEYRLPLVSVVVFLFVWQIAGSRVDPILLSTPVQVATSFWQILIHGPLPAGFLASFEDLASGFSLAVVVGIGLGILMGRYRRVEKVLDPYVSFMNATPLVAIVPVVIIWFGIGFGARMFFVFILSLWPVLVNTVAGTKNVNRGMMEVATSFGLSESQIVRWVAIPSAVPYILAGVRVGLGKGIVGMIIGEMDMQLAGFGGLVANYGDAFQTADLFAVIICTSIFGVIFTAVLNLFQHKAYSWIAETSGVRR